MKFSKLLLGIGLILALIFAATNDQSVSVALAAPNADCESSGSATVTGTGPFSAITFTCSSGSIVYFGICDSGPVIDDLMTISFDGGVVSSNSIVGTSEAVSVGVALVSAGNHTAQINRVNFIGGATYSFATSTSSDAVVNQLKLTCGSDFATATVQQTFAGCNAFVPVFTEDTAPTDGTLVYTVAFGTQNRKEGLTLQSWNLMAGQRVNNSIVITPTPEYARVWWQPAGEDTWYLLPSQYWTDGGGTLGDEYGASCSATQQAPPSYHTAFSRMIAESNVPVLNR